MNQRQRLGQIGAAPTDEQWAVISERRPEPGTTWLLVVTSTGVACLPGCAARTPGRDRVRIVASLDEALAAGARPCLRCHPERQSGAGSAAQRVAATRTEREAVEATVGKLAAAFTSGDDIPGDRELAAAVGLSERRLREIFRERLGVTPRGWVSARRSERLRAHLAGGRDVLGALFDAGYGSSSAAYEAAGGELGMAPGRYRTGGVGERIRWTATPIPDGVALVATTERGLCTVRLGKEPAALESELRAEFPRATVTRDDPGMAEMASLVSDLAVGRPRPEVSGAAAGRPRDGVPSAGLGGAAAHPRRRDPLVRPGGRRDRRPEGGAGRRRRLRREPGRGRGAVPSSRRRRTARSMATPTAWPASASSSTPSAQPPWPPASPTTPSSPARLRPISPARAEPGLARRGQDESRHGGRGRFLVLLRSGVVPGAGRGAGARRIVHDQPIGQFDPAAGRAAARCEDLCWRGGLTRNRS